MRIKRYRLKDGITREQLIENGCKEGGSWICRDKKITLFINKTFYLKKSDFEFDIAVGFTDDITDWDDFNNVTIIDEDFGQPYTPFYGDNWGAEITKFPALEYCIEKYNEFMSSLPFLEEVFN